MSSKNHEIRFTFGRQNLFEMGKEKVIGECRLCGCEGELCKSHIIPKFVYKWMKDNGSGILRSLGVINRPKEDGWWKHLLCASCESKFHKLEHYVSGDVFHPIWNGTKTEVETDARFYQFIISVFWRLIEADAYKPFLENERQTEEIEKARILMHFLLIGRRNNLPYDVMMVFADRPFKSEENENVDAAGLPYFSIGTDSYAQVTAAEEVIMVFKIPMFTFFMFDSRLRMSLDFSSGKSLIQDDFLITNHTDIPIASFIGQVMLHRLDFLLKSTDSLSPKQAELIRERGKEKCNAIQNTPVGRILKEQGVRFE